MQVAERQIELKKSVTNINFEMFCCWFTLKQLKAFSFLQRDAPYLIISGHSVLLALNRLSAKVEQNKTKKKTA